MTDKVNMSHGVMNISEYYRLPNTTKY